MKLTLAILVLVLAGCGGGDYGPDDPDVPPDVPAVTVAPPMSPCAANPVACE